MQKPAETKHAIHALLQERWSPRAYTPQPVEEEKLLSLLEAARWSPSGGNQQPWSFVIVSQDEAATHQGLIEAMTGRNPAWAKNAPILLVAVAKLNQQRPEGNRFAFYDVGQAIAHLSIQAHASGLHVHQMAGFDPAKVRELLQIPEGYELLTISAIGYMGELETLPEDLREREILPRTRKPLAEIVFTERWNHPLETVTKEVAAGD